MKRAKTDQTAILLSHPTGNSNTRAVAVALQQKEQLHSFHTCVAVGNDSINPLRKWFYRQRKTNLPDRLIKTYPWRELARLLSEKTAFFPKLRTHETGLLCVDRIYSDLDAAVAKWLQQNRAEALSAVYAYEDGALATFQAAAERQMHCFYDLPIGYWRAARRIQSEEAELRPEWKATMPALIDSEEKLLRKDAELQIADTVIVASQFTAKTLEEAPFPTPDTFVIPYPCPSEVPKAVTEQRSSGDKLKVLFVGSMSQRKGLADLIDAVSISGSAVELTIIGQRVAACGPLEEALRKHRWIQSLPHPGILSEMRAHDVLVFPSLFEGFGLVVTEALSQGIPVIATNHTCAPDIIEDGKEGFIIPIRSPEVISEKLLYLHDNPDRLSEMKENARSCAALMTLKRYAAQLLQCVETRLKT